MEIETKRDLSQLSKRDRQFLAVIAEIALLSSLGDHAIEGGQMQIAGLQGLLGELRDQESSDRAL